MVTPELLDFLRAQLATGMTPTEVERLLVEEGGWDKTDVEEGLAHIGMLPVPPPPPAPVVVVEKEHVVSMNVAPTPITAQAQITVLETVQPIEEPTPLPTEPVPQSVSLPVEEPAPVVLAVRSERPEVNTAPVTPASDDFLGIFNSTEASVPPASVVVEEPLIHVDAPQEPMHPLLPPLIKKEAPVTPNLMEMLAPVSAPPEISPPVVVEALPVTIEPTAAVLPTEPEPIFVLPPTPEVVVSPVVAVPEQVAHSQEVLPVGTVEAAAAAPMVKFDLSRIKQDKPAVAPAAPTIPIAVPAVAGLPDLSKPIETRSVAELWLTQGKVEAQPAQDDVKEKELRAALSTRRTMTSDLLLRGKGATIQGLPALISAVDDNPMPQYSSPEVTEAKEARKIVQDKKAELAKPKPKLTPAEEITRKNKIKKTIGIGVGALVLVALIAGGAVAFVSMRGPNVSNLLGTTMANFFAAPSFTYIGTATSDLVLTSKSSDGVTRNGTVKFGLDYAGELVNDKYGFENGNHHLKWSGGLSSGNFSWSTDIESDLRLLGTNLFFHVLAFPPQSDIDPELFKTYWIRVDIAEIAKELALDTVAGGDSYNGIAGTESTTFNAVIAKDMPFIGGEKVGSEDVGGISTTHFTLKTDPEKMFNLANDLYKKYLGKSFAVNTDSRIRMMNALEKLKFEIWVDEKTNKLVQLKVAGDLDDDILDVHVKGPIAMSFAFTKYAAPVNVIEPAPFLTLDELHARMNDYKKGQQVRSRDAVYINGLGEIEHALSNYMSAKGRYPTTLSELRTDDVLAVSTLSDDLLKLYLYAPYIKGGDFSKANKCLPKSKVCSVYHIGVNLDDLANPQLSSDADQTSDVHGTDASGCSIEREKACYDVLHSAPALTATSTKSQVNI